ncbi:alternative oxidase, mitochondrial [Lingula anatina]|uniref:Alternative oxidase, mitochondrial n=1 Tax=Lingula anatina TaxID=7574 RepID=A0A1S3GY21_LINAN|nr:alternative oxidase, mitochondrial [Lingula anatina]|eukprot:XP_013378562.1 alternative oxidase, mitochondrial [Lingula anatina]
MAARGFRQLAGTCRTGCLHCRLRLVMEMQRITPVVSTIHARQICYTQPRPAVSAIIAEAKERSKREDYEHFRMKEYREADEKAGKHTSGDDYLLPHPVWTEKELKSVEISHHIPECITDYFAYYTIQGIRGAFDFVTGFNRSRTEHKWVNRIMFLETVAGVPGMVAAMVRHLRSLRKMLPDHGWIHTLIEEAENERMHLMTAIQLRQPGLPFRLGVIGAQGGFLVFFAISYLISPRYCHRLVGYLEEEAVKTYTKCLRDIDAGCLTEWNIKPAPPIAIKYWNMSPNAVMRDVVLNLRADETTHREVNHSFANNMRNPHVHNQFKPGDKAINADQCRHTGPCKCKV